MSFLFFGIFRVVYYVFVLVLFFFLRVMSLFLVVVLVYFLFEGRLWSLSLSLRGESWATYCLLLLAKLRIQFPDLVMDKKQARSFL